MRTIDLDQLLGVDRFAEVICVTSEAGQELSYLIPNQSYEGYPEAPHTHVHDVDESALEVLKRDPNFEIEALRTAYSKEIQALQDLNLEVEVCWDVLLYRY